MISSVIYRHIIIRINFGVMTVLQLVVSVLVDLVNEFTNCDVSSDCERSVVGEEAGNVGQNNGMFCYYNNNHNKQPQQNQPDLLV